MVQNLEWSNVERPKFRNFKFKNIKIAKEELFDYFINEFLFYYDFASSLRKLCLREKNEAMWSYVSWFYRILNFLKKERGSSNFRKIRAIVLKLHTNILYPSRNFSIGFGGNQLKRSNFFRFWIFWEISQSCLT